MENVGEKRKGLLSLLPATRNTNPVFLLAIDGGGIRSLLSLYAMKFIENEVGVPISSIFDIITASSTSTLVASGLAVPSEDAPREPMYSADDLLQVITSSMPEIFPDDLPVDPYVTRPRYDIHPLEDFLEVFFPGNFDSSLTGLVFPAYDRISEDQYLFTSWADIKPKLTFKEVLRATVASPNYFPEVDMVIDKEELKLVDGCFHAYNPTSVVLAEARRHFPFQPTVVLSLGSGNVERLKPPFIPRTAISPVWGSPYHDQKIRCRAELMSNYMKNNAHNYARVQIELTRMEDALLSDYHEATQFFPSTLETLEEVGKRYIEKNQKPLIKFCDYFRRRRIIVDPLSERNGWELPASAKAKLSQLHDLMAPLDYIEPDDEIGLARAKRDLIQCLELETAEVTKMKYRFFVFKQHPLYKRMKKWLDIIEHSPRLRSGQPPPSWSFSDVVLE